MRGENGSHKMIHKKKYTKRKNTKRKNTKRRNTKRKNTKRKKYQSFSQKKSKKRKHKKRKQRVKKIYLLPFQRGGDDKQAQQLINNDLDNEQDKIISDIKNNISKLINEISGESTPVTPEIQELSNNIMNQNMNTALNNKLSNEDLLERIRSELVLLKDSEDKQESIKIRSLKIEQNIMTELLRENKELIENLLSGLKKNEVVNKTITQNLQTLINMTEEQRDEINNMKQLKPLVEELSAENRLFREEKEDHDRRMKEMGNHNQSLIKTNNVLTNTNAEVTEEIREIMNKLKELYSDS